MVRCRSRYLFCLSRVCSRCLFLRASASGPVSKAHARRYLLDFSASLDGRRFVNVSVSIIRDEYKIFGATSGAKGANRVMSQVDHGKIFVLRSRATFVFPRPSLLLSYVSSYANHPARILNTYQISRRDTPLSFVEQECQDM